MSYPDLTMKKDINYAYKLLENDLIISSNNITIIKNLIQFINTSNLIYLQEYYVSIFDRKKDFSLYLFEHIHGDSRERGMAMIDLLDLYKKSNFILTQTNELPDFLPLFLEYLSVIPENKSALLLGEIINIIAVLGKRLKLINSEYYSIFELLESISPVKCDSKIITQLISTFKSATSLDKEWEEPKIF
ncbi:MAG TPA: nitrate reductase molybdenum cofactor assembly chaperone [Candidatus Azoamicus sp. OHIO2]